MTIELSNGQRVATSTEGQGLNVELYQSVCPFRKIILDKINGVSLCSVSLRNAFPEPSKTPQERIMRNERQSCEGSATQWNLRQMIEGCSRECDTIVLGWQITM